MKLARPILAYFATYFSGVLLVAVMATLGCSHQDEQAQQIVRPVKVSRIVDQSDREMSFAGDVRARYETILSFRVAGKLLTRHIDVGDRVRKGQVLAQLDQNDYRLAVQDLHAQLASAVANRDFLRDDVARYRELVTQNVTSSPEFDRHQTAYTTARERAAALEAQLGHAVNQLAYTALSADRDGVVTALEVERGQVVSAGQAIVKLAQLDEKEIHFDVPEHRLPGLKRQQAVNVTLWTAHERRLKGQIREIASSADPASRTYRVKATLLEDQDTAQLGMTATVWISSSMSSRMTIPLSAVFTPQNKPGQPHVWLVDEQTGTVRSVPVQVGEPMDGEHIAVTGLASGQWLITAGVQRLAEGQAVRLPDAIALAMNRASAENGGRQP
ncbi:MAG: efflux RND transporter periplasmic adaptor subunit [Nitrospira sp. BO4]|jgi:multidrug efflux system membrane fusion protein|nr:efflux RND transporter periplasmic adaptor subunit [Nitrospira sp. BO4]